MRKSTMFLVSLLCLMSFYCVVEGLAVNQQKSKLAQRQDRIQMLEKDKENLQKRLETTQMSNANLQKRNTDLQEKNNTLLQYITKLQNYNKELVSKVERLKTPKVTNKVTKVSSKPTAKRTFTVEATAYGTGTKTATGTRPKAGRTISVDPKVIPLGSIVRVESDTFPSVNGVYKAEDTGGAIKGRKIDIFMEGSRKHLLDFGRRKVKVTILEYN